MTSGHGIDLFAGAAAVSEYFDCRWYVAIPEYAGAFAIGFPDRFTIFPIASGDRFGLGVRATG